MTGVEEGCLKPVGIVEGEVHITVVKSLLGFIMSKAASSSIVGQIFRG